MYDGWRRAASARPYTFTRTFVPANREIQERFCTEQNHLVAKLNYRPGSRLSGLAVNTSISVLTT